MQKDDRRFKLFMAAECCAYIVHFALLGGPTAVASSTMSLLRSNKLIAGSVGGTALEMVIAFVNIVTIRRMAREEREKQAVQAA